MCQLVGHAVGMHKGNPVMTVASNIFAPVLGNTDSNIGECPTVRLPSSSSQTAWLWPFCQSPCGLATGPPRASITHHRVMRVPSPMLVCSVWADESVVQVS
jgi:hypothetical protein